MDHIFCPFEIKSDNSNHGYFTGYGSTFGNIDSSGDVVAKGAFNRTIADAKSGVGQWPALLLHHGGKSAASQMPVGIWLDMAEDDKGLRLTGKLANTKNGRDAYALLQMKPWPALDGLSIGYKCTDYEMHKAGSSARRTIKAVDLIEVSLVTFPANSRARVTAVKSRLVEREEDWKKSAIADFERLRRLTNGK